MQMLESLTLKLKPCDLANWEAAAKHRGVTVEELVAEATNEAVRKYRNRRGMGGKRQGKPPRVAATE